MSLQFNANTSYGTNFGNIGTTTPLPTNDVNTGPRGLVFSDNILSLNGQSVLALYLQNINAPILPTPNDNARTQNQNPPNQRTTSESSKQEVAYQKSFASHLEQIAQKQELTEKQVNQLVFAEMTGIPPSDPKLNELLNQVHSSVTQDMVQTFGDSILSSMKNLSGPKSDAGKTFSEALNHNFETNFQYALKQFAQENGLSESQIAKLEFAHNNPDAVTDPTLKQMLAQINSQAISSMPEGWGIPKGFVPQTDSSSFNAKMESNYDEAFDQLLQGSDLSSLSRKMGMSEDQLKGLMTFLHFNTELAPQLTGNSDQIKKQLGLNSSQDLQTVLDKLGKLESDASVQIAKEFGLPEGFQPKAGSLSYQSTLEGRFASEFRSNLQNQDPPLTKEQIAAVKSALINPSDPNISPETQSIIKNIHAQTLKQIQAEFNLPIGWSPPEGLMKSLINTPSHLVLAENGLDSATEQLHLIGNFVNQMENDPSRALMVNVLKLVSDAISNLKNQIALMQVSDSELSAKVSKAESEAVLYKLKLQNDKIAEAQKKARKLKPLMGFLKIFGALFKVLMALLTIMTGGLLGVVFAASQFQDLCTGGKQNFVTDMFKAIMKDLPSPANIFVSIGVLWASTMAGSFPNPLLQMQVFFQNSQIIPQIVKSSGGSEMAGEMANMIAQMGAEIILMIILTVVTGGAAGAALIAEIQSAVAQITIKTLQIVCQTLQKVMTALEKMGKVGQMAAKVVEKVLNGATKAIWRLENVVHELGRLTDVGKQIANTTKAIENIKKTGDVGKQVSSNLKLTENVVKEVGDVQIKVTEKIQKQLPKTLEELQDHLAKLVQQEQKIQAQIEKLGGNALDKVVRAAETFKAGVAVVQGGVSAAVSIMQGQLSKALAGLEAQIEELENLIKILENTLQKIMQGIQSLSSWYGSLGDAQSKMWSDLSQTTTSIAGANQS